MPTYDYDCGCGSRFALLRAIDHRDEPAPCPRCGGGGRRAVAAPRLAALPRATRVAHERNERSAHEPRLVRRAEQPAPPPAARPALDTHHHGRPWMLGH